MTALAGTVILNGTSGNDTINGSSGDEVLVGHAGADTLNGGGGNDTLYAGELSPSWTAPSGDYPYLFFTPPVLDTGADVDILNGGAGLDIIFGGYGDWIDGGADGANLLIGLAGAGAGVTADFRSLADGGTLTIAGGQIRNITSVVWIEGSSFDDFITGANQNSDGSGQSGIVFGLGGNDHLVAGSSTGQIFGGDGNDLIESSYGGSTYYGDAGDDVINVVAPAAFSSTTVYGGDGNDEIMVAGLASGGAGDDAIVAAISNKFGLTANGDEGNDTLTGDNLSDKLAGGDGADVIDGGGGNDILMSEGSPDWLARWAGLDQWLDYGATFDRLFGGGGDDVIYAGYGDDVDGGAGNDSLILSLFPGNGVTLNVADLETDKPFTLFWGTIQRIEHVSMLFGSIGNDVLTLSTGIPVYGMSGDDTINGSLLADDIYGNDGNDTLNGSNGADHIHGGFGADIIDGGAGDDTIHIDDVGDIEPGEQIRGGLDVDTLVVSFPDNGIWGDVSLAGVSLTSVEVLSSEQSKLGVSASQLTDVTTLQGYFYFESAGVVALGGKSTPYGIDLTLNSAGNTLYLDGFSGSVTVNGSGSADTVDGSASGDRIYGNDGNDVIGGRGGNDLISGGAGDDWIDGHDGNDDLRGDEGSDRIDGGTGNDRLDGVEYWYGPHASDSDMLIGGADDDYISAGCLDNVDGGSGFDKLNYVAQGAPSGITADFSQIVSGGTYNIGGVIFTGIEEIVGIVGSEYNDLIVAGPLGAAARIDGGGGNDDLTGGSGANALYGGNGDDILRGGLGADTLAGGDGKDTFKDTAAGLNGDTIGEVFTHDDRIVITDANLAGFAFSLSGNTLTYTGGSLTLNAVEHGHFVATAAAGGGVELKLVQQPVHNNFNGNQGSFRASDVLWQHTNGTVRDWLGQGGFVGNIGKVNIVTGPEWHVIGTGDFNGDGMADVLWKHDNGTVRDWLGQPDASFVGNIGKVNILSSPDWHAVGTGDFNGDGRDDVLWQNDNGTVREWLGQADASFIGNIAHVNFIAPAGTHIVGTGDFNGDGRADILWQSGSGLVTDWLAQADGSFVDNSAKVSINTGPSWHVIGTGDFNGDGFADVLWRNVDGTIREWLGQANGTFAGNIAHVNFIPEAGQRVVGIGDYDGDGIDDLLWQSQAGVVTESMGQNDGSFVANPYVSIPTGTDWHAQDPFVHDLI